jgi:hypothetical protein
MPGKEDDALTADHAEEQLVGGLAERAFDAPPRPLIEPRDIV